MRTSLIHTAEMFLLFMIILHGSKGLIRDWRVLMRSASQHKAARLGRSQRWVALKLIVTIGIAGVTAAAPVLYYSLEWVLKISASHIA